LANRSSDVVTLEEDDECIATRRVLNRPDFFSDTQTPLRLRVRLLLGSFEIHKKTARSVALA
jgi:hypothetical protein